MKISVQQLCEKLGIKELTPMQSEVLKASENEGDIQLISPTGSGKTLGFLFAMLKNWDENATHTQSLIISPTRELAVQIDQVFRSLGLPFKALCIFGGHSLRTELQSMDPCPTLLIGTPGRILDHIDRESIDLSKLNSVIFDEFDKTLEMGFHDEIKAILDNLNTEKKIFSSATELKAFPEFIQLNNPQLHNYSHTNLEVEFFYHHYQREEEFAGLLESLCSFPEGKGIVFCNFRETVDNVVDFLSDSGIKAIGFHGAMEQDERMRAIIQFRNGSYPILVSTDLAARGLDIPAVETVVHFQLPPKEDAFIHRNGRTGRMDAAGRVLILLDKHMDEPEFIPQDKTPIKVPKNISLPDWPNVSTLYLSGGKKDKINKGDILGFLAKKGGLSGKEIGMINVLDHASYVSIPTDKIKQVLSNIHREKIKGQRLKIELSR